MDALNWGVSESSRAVAESLSVRVGIRLRQILANFFRSSAGDALVHGIGVSELGFLCPSAPQ